MHEILHGMSKTNIILMIKFCLSKLVFKNLHFRFITVLGFFHMHTVPIRDLSQLKKKT